MEFINLDDLGPMRYEALFRCSDCPAIDDEPCQPGCNCPDCRLTQEHAPTRTFDVATFELKR